jgi:hypothetical protein
MIRESPNKPTFWRLSEALRVPLSSWFAKSRTEHLYCGDLKLYGALSILFLFNAIMTGMFFLQWTEYQRLGLTEKMLGIVLGLLFSHGLSEF